MTTPQQFAVPPDFLDWTDEEQDAWTEAVLIAIGTQTGVIDAPPPPA